MFFCLEARAETISMSVGTWCDRPLSRQPRDGRGRSAACVLCGGALGGGSFRRGIQYTEHETGVVGSVTGVVIHLVRLGP